MHAHILRDIIAAQIIRTNIGLFGDIQRATFGFEIHRRIGAASKRMKKHHLHRQRTRGLHIIGGDRMPGQHGQQPPFKMDFHEIPNAVACVTPFVTTLRQQPADFSCVFFFMCFFDCGKASMSVRLTLSHYIHEPEY